MQNPLLFPEVRRGSGRHGPGLRPSSCFPTGACAAGRTEGFLCFCRVPRPHPPSVPFWFRSGDVSSPASRTMASPCPRGPSLLTPQLRDGPERGWPSDQPEQPSPPQHPPPQAPALAPRPLRGPPPSSMAALPCGHQGAAILDMPSPSRWVTGPHLQGLTFPPQAPLFLFKGTDCNLGAGTCLPPAPGSPKARYRPSHRPRTGARAGGTVLPEARAPSPRRPLAYAMPSVGPCK